MCGLSLRLCPTLQAYATRLLSVHGMLQASILEWTALPSCEGIFPTQEWKPRLFYLLHWRAASLSLLSPGKTPAQYNAQQIFLQGENSSFLPTLCSLTGATQTCLFLSPPNSLSPSPLLFLLLPLPSPFYSLQAYPHPQPDPNPVFLQGALTSLTQGWPPSLACAILHPLPQLRQAKGLSSNSQPLEGRNSRNLLMNVFTYVAKQKARVGIETHGGKLRTNHPPIQQLFQFPSRWGWWGGGWVKKEREPWLWAAIIPVHFCSSQWIVETLLVIGGVCAFHSTLVDTNPFLIFFF